MRRPLDSLRRKIDYSFSQPQLLERALTHRSAGKQNNERLEFLGDAALGLVIAQELYDRFPGADEGDLSRLRASLVKGDTLAELAVAMELGAYLLLGPGELKSGGASRGSILAGAVEAIIGAVYSDGGFNACRNLIFLLYRDRLAAISPELVDKDPKTRLQEYLQAKGLAVPLYEVLSVVGTGHTQQFRVLCTIESLGKKSEGSGSSRRKAEQEAALKIVGTLT